MIVLVMQPAFGRLFKFPELQLRPWNIEIRILPVMSVCSGLNGLDIDWNENGERQHCD